MEKKHIIRFLKEGKRGSYTLLVQMYADVVTSMSIRMALELIKEDLEKESGETVEIHYFSLARAISRLKKKNILKPGALTAREREFKDAHEIQQGQLSPGNFDSSKIK
jgi:hypothetical protein